MTYDTVALAHKGALRVWVCVDRVLIPTQYGSFSL